MYSVFAMKVVASGDALEFIRRHGGKIYVWTTRQACCHGAMFTVVDASIEPPRGAAEFRPIATEGFQLLLGPSVRRQPSELSIELRGRHRKHVKAYWDGGIFVV